MLPVLMRVLVAVLLALAVVAAQFVYGGLMRTVFSIPCYALVALAGVLGISALFWKRAQPPVPTALISTLLAGGYLLWRSFYSPGQDLSLFYVFLVTACVTVYCLFACVLTSPVSRYVFISILLLAAMGQVVVAGIQFSEPGYYWPLPWFSEQVRTWYFKPDAIYLRGHGIFLNANHLAWFLNGLTFLSLGVACLGRIPVWGKVIFTYMAAVCVVGTVLTLSRGGLLGLGVGMVTFLILSLVALGIGARDRRIAILLVILSIIAAVSGGGYYLFSKSMSAQVRMGKIMEDTYRTSLFPVALRQVQLEPLMGTGAGSFTQLSRQLKDLYLDADDTFAHNDWVQITADFGFVGLVLLTGVFLLNMRAGLTGFIDALKQRMSISSRPQSNSAAFEIGALSALMAFAAHSFFDFNMQIPANALFAAACTGMLANSGVSTGNHTGWNRGARWIAGLASVVAGGFLSILIFYSAETEWIAFRAENALIRGDIASSAKLSEQGLKLSPSHSRLRRLYGETLLKGAPSSKNPRENYVLSTYNLRKSTELDPNERWNQLMLAISLSSLRQQKAAESAHIEAIRLDPGNSSVREYYALFLEGEGKKEEAIRAYEASLCVPGTQFAYSRLRALRQLKK